MIERANKDYQYGRLFFFFFFFFIYYICSLPSPLIPPSPSRLPFHISDSQSCIFSTKLAPARAKILRNCEVVGIVRFFRLRSTRENFL